MNTNLAIFTDTAEGWQRALYAFLAEKEQHSGSRRTVDGYTTACSTTSSSAWASNQTK